jgi:hypothetical protein
MDGRAIAGWALVGMSAAASAAASSPAPEPRVRVVLNGTGQLPASAVLRAQSIASDLFREAGVTIVWAEATDPPGDRGLTITLTPRAEAAQTLGADAMGVAPSPGDGTRGTQAYVFADRVAAFANLHAVPLGYVLASAIAHELGHLLLPPSAHTADGIMRATWHPGLFPPKSPGLQGFQPAQARLLRRRVNGLPADPHENP